MRILNFTIESVEGQFGNYRGVIYAFLDNDTKIPIIETDFLYSYQDRAETNVVEKFANALRKAISP